MNCQSQEVLTSSTLQLMQSCTTFPFLTVGQKLCLPSLSIKDAFSPQIGQERIDSSSVSASRVAHDIDMSP